MKHVFFVLAIMFFMSIVTNAQCDTNDIKVIDVNKKVNEYQNQFDLSSPVKSFVTFKYLKAEGREGKYREVNSFRNRGYFPNLNSPDVEVEKTKQEKLLNTKIEEVIVYKDSVAGVITEYADPMCIVTYLSYEGGKWLNAGEDLGTDLDNAKEVFESKCNNFLGFIHRIKELKVVHNDPTPFVNYLKKNGKYPKDFMLDVLASHKIVIYGEVHRRQVSWEFMSGLIRDPKFVEEVGTVFMELSSDKQAYLDRFFSSKKIKPGIILDIFRNVQIDGWYDKGMYEFLIDLWSLNRALPSGKRIKVVCTDEPRPFDSFKTKEEMEAYFDSIPDRNTQMAKIISENVKASKDTRNNLFIVGCAHAYKSGVGGVGVDKPVSKAEPTAAYQLAQIFSPEEVFSIFPHCLIIDNHGHIFGGIRNGLFDLVFKQYGNEPVAFKLKDSPFGQEPFDAINEITYEKGTGSFENNYDAYMFLEPLADEGGEYLLPELVTDDFVQELKRRAAMVNTTVEKWFGINEATKEAIVEKLKSRAREKRWEQK